MGPPVAHWCWALLDGLVVQVNLIATSFKTLFHLLQMREYILGKFIVAQPIDAVVTWVDGNDPKLLAKQRKYFKADEKDDVTSQSRYVESNELYYCLGGIIKNLPFVRRIFIITDQQVPGAIEQIRHVLGDEAAEKITIVDHTEIFKGYEEYLPVFNSPAIETMMHRIPDLSDRYIYFNDDFFVVRPMQEGDFFNGNRPILRGIWRSFKVTAYNRKQRDRMLNGKFHLPAKLFSYKETQSLAFKFLGETEKFFWHDHTPHPFFKPDIDAYFSKNEDKIRSNISHRIRHRDQFDIMSLANAIDIQKGDYSQKPMSLTCLKATSKVFQRLYVKRKRRSAMRKGSQFLCFQAMVDAHPKAQKEMFRWLDDAIFS